MDASGGLPAGQIVGLPATELAARVRSGELTAVEVVRAHLAHLEGVEPRVGAFRVVRREAALAEAHAIDTALTRFALPLAGVPVAVKDNVAVAGEICTDGSPACPAGPAARDHEVVARLRKAGAVVIGITRAPELCLYAATDGPGSVSRNPWDTARSPAGSSGGSAAAVASGSVPLAHGNDGMGSLRLPAAACGLLTLKPGTGVVPADIGADAAHLTAAGHTVVRREPPITLGAAAGALARWMVGAEDDAEHLGIDRRALQPRSRTHARIGRLVRRAGLVRPRTAERFRARMVTFFGDVDVLLTPVTTGPPLAARPWHERGFLANITANARWAPWTSAWNLAGLPALVLPAGPGREGLPSSVQFVGPAGAETRLLWLAGELGAR